MQNVSNILGILYFQIQIFRTFGILVKQNKSWKEIIKYHSEAIEHNSADI